MLDCQLILYPNDSEKEFAVDLSADAGGAGTDRVISKSKNMFVFSDKGYYFALSFRDCSIIIRNVKVYINDVFEPSQYDGMYIHFRNDKDRDRAVFSDCYGFVQISLKIVTVDDKELYYTSDYIPVLVKDNEFNDCVRAMVNYVYSNQEFLLLNGEPKARGLGELKEKGYKNLAAQIILAGEIASIYEMNYGFFKANSRFKTERRNRIDSFEHLQYVTPATVRYISTHPEELTRIEGTSGIRIGNSIFQPRNTLSEHNEVSHDIYENRVILGFLLTMINAVDEMLSKCESLLSRLPDTECNVGEYIYSSAFMFSETKKSLTTERDELKNLKTKYSRLYTMYRDIFRIKAEPFLREPESTHIFLSIPQYNRIFLQIHRWFTYGIYNFDRERLMLSFIKISSMYEGYLLEKMINYFRRDYVLESARCYKYHVGKNSQYINTPNSNTFIFTRGRRRVTLYYQPVIFGSDSYGFNGIGLMRNNTIIVSEDDEDLRAANGGYYSPDYIIKVEEDGKTSYLILDAKFSSFNTVRKTYVRNLAFKYLFSISPVDDKDVVVGLCLIYGKCSFHDEMQSTYDNQLPTQHIRPIAEMIPMMEGIKNDKHFSRFDALMDYLSNDGTGGSLLR